MASILERNRKAVVPKKTVEDHAEDALYREIWEEVHAQKTYDFVRKYAKPLAVAAIAILIAVAGWQLARHNRAAATNAAAEQFAVAESIAAGGRADLAAEAFARMAENSSGGMSDIALFRAARLDMDSGNRDAGIAKLEKLAADGATRDFRDLAVLNLALARGDSMTAADFEKFLSSLQTKRSPFYYTGLLLVAQKYIAAGDHDSARRALDKITTDKDAPATISAMAESLR
ncbi:MAG: tetratricopeptide repeat protein [Proteobacteria bacterium]|nr:tetratricopeptide repeat protein [Pseudomonadota bacterium]